MDQPAALPPKPASDNPVLAPVAAQQDAAECGLHPKLPGLWARLAAMVTAGPALGAGVTLAVFELWLFALLPLVVVVAVPWLVWRYGRRAVAAFRCRFSAAGLQVSRGVWWRSETFVPLGRVQHTDVDQGPLARRRGMATLKVFTAGSTHSEIEIDGLRHEDAVRLRDAMLQRHERTTA